MLIGLTGRIGAGKGVIVDYIKEKGFKYYTLSQVVREEAAKRGIDVSTEEGRGKLQDLGNLIRQQEGPGAWVKRILSKIEGSEDYIIDKIINPAEIEELRKTGDFYLISVDAPQEDRFQRVLKRDKDSDPKEWEAFLEIDNRDFGEEDPLGQQVGKCMELADYSLVNDSTWEIFQEKIKELCEKIKC